jgi:MSHA biogenesis protein MshP
MYKPAQKGFSLVTAIFLLVVLSLLGAMMVSFFTVQQQTAALDVMGSRAYQASRAGVEWSAFQVLQSGVAGPAVATACQAPGGTAQTLPALGGSLSPFTVRVSCSAASHVEAAGTVWVYSISSVASTTGSAAGSPDYVERQIQMTIGQ